jgi:hypothetical protein
MLPMTRDRRPRRGYVQGPTWPGSPAARGTGSPRTAVPRTTSTHPTACNSAAARSPAAHTEIDTCLIRAPRRDSQVTRVHVGSVLDRKNRVPPRKYRYCRCAHSPLIANQQEPTKKQGSSSHGGHSRTFAGAAQRRSRRVALVLLAALLLLLALVPRAFCLIHPRRGRLSRVIGNSPPCVLCCVLVCLVRPRRGRLSRVIGTSHGGAMEELPHSATLHAPRSLRCVIGKHEKELSHAQDSPQYITPRPPDCCLSLNLVGKVGKPAKSLRLGKCKILHRQSLTLMMNVHHAPENRVIGRA